jgi:hypothetical protein
MAYDKTRLRMEMAVRLELSNLGLTDTDIAAQIGIEPNSFAQMKAKPEYKALRISMVTGTLNAMDMEIAERKEELALKLKHAVPVALETLIHHAMNRVANPKLSLDAAGEILDREGTFVKASRFAGAEDRNKNNFDSVSTPREDAVADELADALNTVRHNNGTPNNLEAMKPVSEQKQ